MNDQTTKLNRRQFLEAGVASALAGTLGSAWGTKAFGADSGPSGQGVKRPNILLIITDEHNASVMGAAGNSIIRTTHMDSLARNGITFENCYCNSPLCVPSRLSITSGKYCSRVSAWNLSTWLPSPDYPSIAHIMNDAGYESVLSGKMHYDYSRRYGFREIWPSPLNMNYKRGRGSRRKPDDLKERPGFSDRLMDIGPGNESSHLNHDRNVTKNTVAFLKNRKADDRPFFMINGFICPHFPLIVPDTYYEQYKGRVPMPNNPPASVAAQPLNYKHLRVGFHVGHVPPDVIKQGRELYYGLTHWVDDQIGQVLSALRDSAVADDTIVIYTADHGEDMGEHALWWKNCMYESAAHVPLIVSYPRRWQGGQRRKGVCSLVDVVQTVADLGGTKAPADWNGTPLTPLLDDPNAKWKDMAVSEYYAHNIASGYAMIRHGQFKFTYHTAPDAKHPVQRQLFDLGGDPAELTNLAEDDKYKDQVAGLHDMLVAEIGESPDETEKRCRAEIAKGYDRNDEPPSGLKKRKAKKAFRAEENTDD